MQPMLQRGHSLLIPIVRVRRIGVALATLFVLASPVAKTAQSDALPSFKAIDTVEARVQGCVTCHGQSGQGTNNGYFPRIAGKPDGDLFNQLLGVRIRTRLT